MFKILFVGILSLFLALQPATDEILYQSDPKAKEILDETSDAFKAMESLKADLTITIQLPEREPYEQKSTVYLKGQNYKLDMEFEEIICDNKSIWRYLKDMNEVQINDFEPSDNEITPANIFNIYENDFYYLYVGPTEEAGKTYEEIELSPMDKSKSYFKVKVWINTADMFIYKMKVFDKNGSRYTYAITNLDKQVELADDFFIFDAADYPKVRVEDLRF